MWYLYNYSCYICQTWPKVWYLYHYSCYTCQPWPQVWYLFHYSCQLFTVHIFLIYRKKNYQYNRNLICNCTQIDYFSNKLHKISAEELSCELEMKCISLHAYTGEVQLYFK